MVYCDKNDNILEWASEEIAIPYRSPVDNRVHRYFPDFYMKVKERGGKIKRYVIEVKPAKQTKARIKTSRLVVQHKADQCVSIQKRRILF